MVLVVVVDKGVVVGVGETRPQMLWAMVENVEGIIIVKGLFVWWLEVWVLMCFLSR